VYFQKQYFIVNQVNVKQARKVIKEFLCKFNFIGLGIKSSIIFLNLMIWILNGSAQNVNREFQNDYAMNQDRKILRIPDIPGYQTLKGDFHIHTVFSDGHVWPDFRVVEAWTEGLDVIAITDHIEYHSHTDDITSDNLNLGYERAKVKANNLNILLIPGAEISKKVPPGHLNALFIKDVNKLRDDDPMIQIEEAVKQGAFILWNHPGWGWAKPLPDTTKWWDFQTAILDKGWLHGIEVYNTEEWYQVALKWGIEKELTVFANSDIHAPINYWYDLSHQYSHRPMTLVFAKSRTLDGVKEALFERRTLAYFDDILAGKEELINELFHASIILHPPFRQVERNGEITYFAELENPTDLTFIMNKEGIAKNNDRSDIVKLLPESITIINYKGEEVVLNYRLKNCYSDIKTHPLVQLPALKK
jgi:3',5'-nucleoside bisphosphate phosphatase